MTKRLKAYTLHTKSRIPNSGKARWGMNVERRSKEKKFEPPSRQERQGKKFWILDCRGDVAVVLNEHGRLAHR